jgi:hypothetical protein
MHKVKRTCEPKKQPFCGKAKVTQSMNLGKRNLNLHAEKAYKAATVGCLEATATQRRTVGVVEP